MKRILAIVFSVILFALVLTSCSSIKETTSSNPTTESTPASGVTSTPEVTSTPKPAEDLVMKEKLALMPDVAGFQKVIKDVNGVQKNVYVAIKGNEYGLEAGVDGGYFKEEVIFEGEQVGGIAFDAKVVQKLLAEKGGKAIFIPADSDEVNKENIYIDFFGISFQGKEYKNVGLKVDTGGYKISIFNPIFDSGITNQSIVKKGLFPDFMINGIEPLSDNKNEYAFKVLGDFNFEKPFQGIAPLGQKMTETEKVFGLILNSKLGPKSIEEDEILKIDKSIVFLEDLG